MRIIGPPSATREKVQRNLALKNPHARFINEMFPHLWTEAERLTVDPVGMVAQSFKETGGGAYGGQVKPQFYNPCGLKVRHMELFPGVTDGDKPLAHAMFPSWQVGCRAQAQHLRIYAGWPVSVNELVVDPRYALVNRAVVCQTWVDLSRKWAPSASYGQEIEVIMKDLRA